MHALSVTALNVHPLKSGSIRSVDSSEVSARGLADDRSWMVVDPDGVLVSARELRQLFRVVPDTHATDPSVRSGLRLSAEGHDDLQVEIPTGIPVRARLHSQELLGIPAGEAADSWLHAVVERDDLRLLWCDDPTRRTLNPDYSTADDFTAYADGYPVTVASEASLRQLNEWLVETARDHGEDPQTLPMARFRPNVVIDGDLPFTEDRWTRVTIGGVAFRVAKPVDRCVMTTIDPVTLASAKEPIRTLARHRLVGGKTLFAIHLIPDGHGRISVGDAVEPTTQPVSTGRDGSTIQPLHEPA